MDGDAAGETPEVQFTLKRDGGDKSRSERVNCACLFIWHSKSDVSCQSKGRSGSWSSWDVLEGPRAAAGPGAGGCNPWKHAKFYGRGAGFPPNVFICANSFVRDGTIRLRGPIRSCLPNHQQLWLYEVSVLCTYFHLFPSQSRGSEQGDVEVGSKR